VKLGKKSIFLSRNFQALRRVARWRIFKPKILIWIILEDLAMEAVRLFHRHLPSLFYSHLVYFVAIWYILWPFGIFCGYLVYFVAIWYILRSFGMLCEEKSGSSGAPCTGLSLDGNH
jgi:hypothetical protein